MKRVHWAFAVLLVVGALAAPGALSSHADVVVRIDAAKGLVSIRDAHTGRVKAFRASAAELATLKVGDEVKANWKTNALTHLKGIAKTAALLEPEGIEPCCSVVAVVKDRAALQALLGGVFAETAKSSQDPAEPVHNLRSRIKGIDAIDGVRADFGSILDGAEPVGAILIAQNNATGALHVVNASVLAADEMSRTSAAITSSIKIGDLVSIDPANGIAMLQNGGGTYAFNLRGIKRGVEPVSEIKGPWVVEPDPKATGQFGIVRTNWHEKSGSGYQRIYVYRPGKRDKEEYNENWKTEHSVLSGEYDIVINGALLEKVPVKTGHATRILLGALHSTAKYENQLAIFDAMDRPVSKIQGTETIALPVGTYHVKVGTRMVDVEIRENQVTEF